MNKKIIATAISAFLVCWGLFFSGANAIQYKVQWNSTTIRGIFSPIIVERWDGTTGSCEQPSCNHQYETNQERTISIDSNQSKHITKLNLSEQNVTEIINMEGASNLKDIDLSRNNIESLWAYAFSWVTYTGKVIADKNETLNAYTEDGVSIDLSHNKISHIDNDAFSGSIIAWQNLGLFNPTIDEETQTIIEPYMRAPEMCADLDWVHENGMICRDVAKREIDLSNNALTEIPEIFIRDIKKDKRIDSITDYNGILYNFRTGRVYLWVDWITLKISEELKQEKIHNRWYNPEKEINLSNNPITVITWFPTVETKNDACEYYNSTTFDCTFFSWSWYNAENPNITSRYTIIDPYSWEFIGEVTGTIAENWIKNFSISPFHSYEDEINNVAHRINWEYKIRIEILSGNDVLQIQEFQIWKTGYPEYEAQIVALPYRRTGENYIKIASWNLSYSLDDIEFVSMEISWNKIQTINYNSEGNDYRDYGIKFNLKVSGSPNQITHRGISKDTINCKFILDNKEFTCYPHQAVGLNLGEPEEVSIYIRGEEGADKINPEGTGYLEMELNNWRDEIVTSDIFYFDYNTASESTESSETTYTVKHFKQNVNGSGWSLADSETFTWIVDDEITPSTKTYTGFTSPSTQSGTILSGGLLTINYYYTRNTYTVTYDSNGWTPIADTGILFEATIPTPTPSKDWFTFEHWNGLPKDWKMPATGVTLTAVWTENSNPWWDPSTPEQTVASYTVKHFKQSITKLYSTTPDEVETFTGIVGDIVSPNVKSYTWFTSPSTTSGTIVSGNSLVIEYRYPRNTYTVTYDSNGWTPIADTGILFEATIPTPTPSKDWFTFEHWNGLPKDWKMPATGVTLTAVWTENSNPWWDPSTSEQTVASYTVKHFKQDVDGSGWSLADTETFTWIVDDIVTPSTKTYTWFSSPNTESKTIPSNWELTINYYYTRNTYTVNYNTNGWDSIPSVNVMFEGIIPTPTPNKNWYSFNGWSGLPTSGLMPANDIILTADWTANSWGGNWSSSSSSSSNWGSSSKWHSSEKTESKTGTIISSGIIMQPINPIASGIIQPTTWENYIMKYISRSCKPYNIEYIPELDAYTSPDLKKKEYFVNFDYLKRYVDSKNAQNAECYIERTWVTTWYIDMNDYTDRFIAPNWKIYFISEENWYYMSSQLSSPKTFATISELKKYIKDRNPLTSMLIYPQTSVTPREFWNTSLKNNSSSNEISTNTIKDNKKDEDVLSELRNQLFSD